MMMFVDYDDFKKLKTTSRGFQPGRHTIPALPCQNERPFLWDPT
jgi:hypothetical protein